ncbi:MAG: alpha-amylase [Acidobacteria bacterium]|nr:alpha-amylase [Acidobacteriota bacterium]
MGRPWWQTAVLYQIYLRSFADSNDDGVGDLRGVIDRLDYLGWLGVDALWLSPVTVSPDRDWGYDVADYRSIQPAFGSLDDLDELVARARERDMRIVLDLVPNHTSDRHPWFGDARASRTARRRSYYVWADPNPDGSSPNNWRSTFGDGPAWEHSPETGQLYLHSFLPEQVDLDWWNEDVRDEFDDVMRFWLDRGIAGFRLDVAHAIVKDRELRDVPAAAQPGVRVDLDETYAVQRRWRALIDGCEGEPRVLIGETWVLELECGGDARKIKCALLALLTLRGTAVLYQGDEIGLEQVDVPRERLRDIAGRDGCRTPIPWTPDGGWREPWLPLGSTARNVAGQREDEASILRFVRDVVARRRQSEDLRSGAYASLLAPRGVWAYRRGRSTVVAINLSDERAEFEGRPLEPWEGAIL